MKFGFVGGSYEGRSKNINSQRTINLYPEIDQEGGKSVVALYGTPGSTEFCDIGSSVPVRQIKYVRGYLYSIFGDKFYRLDSSGTSVELGTLNSSTGYCWIEENGLGGNQIMIVDGVTGYIYNTSTNAFAQITDPDFPGATGLTFMDGYFIVANPNTGEFWVSDLYDGTSWTGTYYASAESWPDDIIGVVNDHRELWLVGSETAEVWYNSGSGSPPFDRKIDDAIQRGLGAPASLTQHDNTLFWLDEHGLAVKAEGYKAVAVSTRQIEYQWSTYSSTSDAIGFSMTMGGHSFWVLNFPSGNATWVYDSSTNMWHERMSSFNTVDGRWRANCYEKAWDRHFIGDFENGKIYELDDSTYDEDGETIKSIRRSPFIHKERKLIPHSRLEIEFEAGVGLVSGQGSDPQAILRWSDDGGHTWSNEHWRGIGALGKYKTRALWNKLGMSRSRVYELTITDPVKRVIVEAELN